MVACGLLVVVLGFVVFVLDAGLGCSFVVLCVVVVCVAFVVCVGLFSCV